MSNNEKLTEAEIEDYILNFTEEPKPSCTDCGDEGEFYDTQESDNYCRDCLIKWLNTDVEGVRRDLRGE